MVKEKNTGKPMTSLVMLISLGRANVQIVQMFNENQANTITFVLFNVEFVFSLYNY